MLIFALISLLLFVPYAALINYYHSAWQAIPLYTPPTTDNPSFHTPISVLIPARNEEENIGDCLDSLFRQTYPGSLYQVIVIDDHSTDRTAAIVQEKQAAMKDSGLRVLYLRLSDGERATGPESPPAGSPTTHASISTAAAGPMPAYKKRAIEAGIRASTGSLIVTTDADCRFAPDWLRTIASFHETTGAKFIAAPVRIGAGADSGSRSLLSIFQTLDFITLQGITGAAVYKKFHSMCNGANLAYTKAAFYEVEGFKNIDAIPSGDDMLLMHKIYTKYPEQTSFLKSPQAIVSTQEEKTWGGFANQRIRWASKASHYEDRRIFWVLLLVYTVNLLFPALILASFWNTRYLWLILLLLILKTTIEYPFVRSAAKFFDQQGLMAWFPALQPLHILYTVVTGWLGKFGSYRWKGRSVGHAEDHVREDRDTEDRNIEEQDRADRDRETQYT